MSKSETRKSSLSDRPYDMNKATMNQLYKRMRTKRLNRQEKFVGQKEKRHDKYTKNYSSLSSHRKSKLVNETRKSRSESNRSRHSSISSSTSLIVRENSDCEVLEQIHSFNLKRGSVGSQKEGTSEMSSMNISNRRSSSTSVQRAFYVSELVKVK